MPEVFIAAGSNAEPVKNLKLALAELEKSFAPLRVSPAYRNKPIGFEGADFINLVVGFETDLEIDAVRQRLQEIEGLCGRPRTAPKWGPRSMDLDILLYGNEVRDEPDLKLPRPDLVRRAYMLKPIADIAPDLRHPTLGKTMRELWSEFEGKDHAMNVVELSSD